MCLVKLRKAVIKSLSVLLKSLAIVFVIYLVATLILLPIAGKIIIQRQGTKLTGQELKLDSIVFNPFTLRLSLNKMRLRSDEKTYIGFEKFYADLSFLSLFKKEIRIEESILMGLSLSITLEEDGRFDILSIIPSKDLEKESSKEAIAMSELPLCFLDSFELQESSISFMDKTVSPSYRLDINNINFVLSELSTLKDGLAKAKLFMNVGVSEGEISSEIFLKPLAKPIEADFNFKIKDYDLTSFSAYVAKFAGNMVDNGKLNLNIATQLSDNRVRSDHKVHIQSFEFGEAVSSEHALNLPFALALAILEDRNKRIQIELPVKGDIEDPEFDYWPAVMKVARNFFMKVVTKPFSILGSLVGLDSSMSEELAYIKFEPGSYRLMDSEKEKIILIANTLKERPRLRIELSGVYDPEVDVLGVKEDIFKQRFEDLKAKSGETDYRVLYKLYRKEYGIYNAWKAIKAYRKNEKLGVNPGLTQDLVKSTGMNEEALKVLAANRARAIYDLFISQGFDSVKVRIGKSQKTQASVGYVALNFALSFSAE